MPVHGLDETENKIKKEWMRWRPYHSAAPKKGTTLKRDGTVVRYRNLAKDWLSGNAQTRLYPKSLSHLTRKYCISALNTPRLKLHKNSAAGTFTRWMQSHNKCECLFFFLKITFHNWNILTFVRPVKPFSRQTVVKQEPGCPGAKFDSNERRFWTTSGAYRQRCLTQILKAAHCVLA